MKTKWTDGVTGILHYGYQHFAGAANNRDSYGDWKVGFNKSFESNGIDVGYYYTGTDTRNDGWFTYYDGKIYSDPAHTIYMTKSF